MYGMHVLLAHKCLADVLSDSEFPTKPFYPIEKRTCDLIVCRSEQRSQLLRRTPAKN